MNNNHQRKDVKNNAHAGRAFENATKAFFATQGVDLVSSFSLPIGIEGKKNHKFDLGSSGRKILIECKSHRWTAGDNVPSAKMTIWNEAMFYFFVAPVGYRKILFVLRDYSEKRRETLAEYYMRTNYHLIPPDVEILEYDEEERFARRLTM